MKYRVQITDPAFEAIRSAALFIADDRKAPLNAQRWLEGLWDAIDTLERMPGRCVLAAESYYRSFEIRKLIYGNYLVLFNLDEKEKVVYVIGFKHGMQHPQGEDRDVE